MTLKHLSFRRPGTKCADQYRCRHSLALVLILALAACLLWPATPANAISIQRVVSEKGIVAWLVEEHTVPLMTMRFAFRGGSVLDPKGKEGLANMTSSLLDEGAGDIEALAGRYFEYRDFIYLGRGINFPIALEGALKLKEISYIHASGYAAGEMKHGPIALIDSDMPVVALAPNDNTYPKMLSNMEEVSARSGRLIAVVNEGAAELSSKGSKVGDIITVPEASVFLTPIILAVPLQLLAYYIAVLKGTDVDQPRNLAKSVTVE